LWESAGGGEAGDDGDGEHNSEGDSGKPVAPVSGSDVSGLDEDGADGEGLDEHFDFAGGDGAEVDTFGLGGVPEDGYVALTDNQNGSDRAADNVKRVFGEIEEDGGLTNYREGNECAADEDFVYEGVEHTAEFGGDVKFSRDGAVDDVGEAGDDKDDEGSIEGICFILGNGRIEEYSEEQYGQNEPAESKNVCNLFQHREKVTFFSM